MNWLFHFVCFMFLLYHFNISHMLQLATKKWYKTTHFCPPQHVLTHHMSVSVSMNFLCLHKGYFQLRINYALSAEPMSNLLNTVWQASNSNTEIKAKNASGNWCQAYDLPYSTLWTISKLELLLVLKSLNSLKSMLLIISVVLLLNLDKERQTMSQ